MSLTHVCSQDKAAASADVCHHLELCLIISTCSGMHGQDKTELVANCMMLVWNFPSISSLLHAGTTVL